MFGLLSGELQLCHLNSDWGFQVWKMNLQESAVKEPERSPAPVPACVSRFKGLG